MKHPDLVERFNAVRRASGINGNGKAILFVLAFLSMDEWVPIGMEDLARSSGIDSAASTSRKVKELEKAGILTVDRSDGGARKNTNQYRINWDVLRGVTPRMAHPLTPHMAHPVPLTQCAPSPPHSASRTPHMAHGPYKEEKDQKERKTTTTSAAPREDAGPGDGDEAFSLLIDAGVMNDPRGLARAHSVEVIKAAIRQVDKVKPPLPLHPDVRAGRIVNALQNGTAAYAAEKAARDRQAARERPVTRESPPIPEAPYRPAPGEARALYNAFRAERHAGAGVASPMVSNP